MNTKDAKLARIGELWCWQDEDRRPNWDELFMMIAQVVATRSTCDRGPKQFFRDHRGTGAVIVSANNRQISVGYNGSPPGLPHCDDPELFGICCNCGDVFSDTDLKFYLIDEKKRKMSCIGCGVGHLVVCEGDHLLVDGHCVRTIHAEENAILNASFPTDGCKLYTTTVPCYDCAKRIIAAGIKEVYYLEVYQSRYDGKVDPANLLEEAGVKLKRITV